VSIVIDIARLNYSYPQASRSALQDIDLRIDSGQRVLLTGLSGSGKSTLLRALNGLVPRFHGGRFEGRVQVAGLDTRHTSIERMAAEVGLVFQEPSRRFVSRSVVDEIAFGLEVAGLGGEDIRQRVDEVVQRFDLGALLERQVDLLSGGEQQRVALAAVLSRRPSLLLLDEPTSQLDAQSSQALIAWVQDLVSADSLTMLVAEHQLQRWHSLIEVYLYLTPEGRQGGFGDRTSALKGTPYDRSLERLRDLIGAKDHDRDALAAALRKNQDNYAEPSHTPGSLRLRADGISFAYNGIPALQSADLSLFDGQVVALMGPNGSGKTTLLRCLMGLNRARSGRIRLDDRFIEKEDVADISRSMAYVPQWPSALLFADTVVDELVWTLRNHHLEDHPPLDPDDLLEELDLGDVADRYPRDLSAGQIQRAALAAVLVTKPGVLLLDEPTLGMDPLVQRRLGQLLKAWRLEGRAVMIATHNVEFAAAYADRVVVMDQGRIVDDGPSAETLFAHPALQTELQRASAQARPASLHNVIDLLEGIRDND
jgi:energy-coupling factor transport system ATP-binding protein